MGQVTANAEEEEAAASSSSSSSSGGGAGRSCPSGQYVLNGKCTSREKASEDKVSDTSAGAAGSEVIDERQVLDDEIVVSSPPQVVDKQAAPSIFANFRFSLGKFGQKIMDYVWVWVSLFAFVILILGSFWIGRLYRKRKENR